MSDIITPAGLALCAALGLPSCVSPWDLTVVQDGHYWMDRANQRMVKWNVPDELAYPIFVSCPDDNFSGSKFCGDGLDCVVIGQYDIYDGNIGHTRVCRKYHGIPTS